jgi:transposase
VSRAGAAQQPDNPAPRRRTFDHLPSVDETCQLTQEQARCPQCGAPFASFPGTDDGNLLEIEVRAYRRRYHRRRYRKTCTCAATPALCTAPPPPKLIPKGYLGVSVWVLLLLEKYAAYQPSYRFLNLLCSFGIDLPLGTITEGLKKLLPLFEPLYRGLAEQQRQEHHWHCDETRWLVFCDYEGKVGHYWGLWAFCSPKVVLYLLDPSRAHDVPETHLAGASGIASVDRATVFKAMAQVKQGQIVLAFCWAHMRRDFLEVLTGYGELNDWVISWLEEIRDLYQRNEERLKALRLATRVDHGEPLDGVPGPAGAAEQKLREHVAHLAQRRDAELQQPRLHAACTKVLTSLRNHWSGLTIFLDHPEVPLDNNAAERAERGPALARKNYYGSGAYWSGRLAAIMFSLFRTLELWHLCPLRWLTAYLTASAQAGAQAPENAVAFLPWNLTVEQKQQWAMPSSQTRTPDVSNSS